MSINIINTALICGEEDLKSLSVAIVSMLENADNSTKYNIIVLSKTSYSESNIDLIYSFKDKYNCEITLTNIDKFYPNDANGISLLVSTAITNIDKCIYLDYNVVVQRDLTELYNFDLVDDVIGAVIDVDFDKFSPSVLLIDCAKIRENDNMDIGNIDLKFNLRAGYFQEEKSFNFSPKVTVGKEVIDSFDKKQLREAFKESVIFSYTDEVNPFVTHDCSFVDEWYKYFSLSPLTTQGDIKTPLISVIVPVYNVEKYLELCVDSIKNQSYKNLEIILIDDGSTDSSGQICDELVSRDTRINVIHQENGGLSSARNSGMDIAIGEYISFIDSDDFIHPKTYSLAINCFNETPDLDLVEWEFKNTPENDTKYYINNFEKIISTQYDVSDNEEYIKANIDYKKHYHLAWNKLFKRELINDIRFEVGKYHEDVFFTNEYLLYVKKAGYISNKLYYYVQRKGSIVNQETTIKNVDGVEGLYQRHLLIKENYPKLIEADLQYALAYGYRRIDVINKQNNDTDKSMRIAIMEILLKYYDYVMEYDRIPQNIKDDFVSAKEDLIGFIEQRENESIINNDILQVIVWGNIGNVKDVLMKIKSFEILNSKIKIVAICNNDSWLHGNFIDELPIISPNELLELTRKTNNYIVLVADINSVIEQLKKIGVSNCVPSYFLSMNLSLNSIQSFNELESALIVCSPSKTGNHTINLTLEKANIDYVIFWHQPYHFNYFNYNNNNKIKVISAVREPIIQVISNIYQELSATYDNVFYNYMKKTFKSKDHFLSDVKNIELFLDFYIENQDKVRPEHIMQNFMSFFAKYILDITKYPFDHEKGYTIIREGNIEVFVYQLEKMNNIAKEMSDWIGQTPFDELVKGNEASGKWIADHYKQAQKEISISKEFFENSYNQKWVQHFYSQEDIEKFKARWRPHIKE